MQSTYIDITMYNLTTTMERCVFEEVEDRPDLKAKTSRQK
jgi:hypothetical protein